MCCSEMEELLSSHPDFQRLFLPFERSKLYVSESNSNSNSKGSGALS